MLLSKISDAISPCTRESLKTTRRRGRSIGKQSQPSKVNKSIEAFQDATLRLRLGVFSYVSLSIALLVGRTAGLSALLTLLRSAFTVTTESMLGRVSLIGRAICFKRLSVDVNELGRSI